MTEGGSDFFAELGAFVDEIEDAAREFGRTPLGRAATIAVAAPDAIRLARVWGNVADALASRTAKKEATTPEGSPPDVIETEGHEVDT